MTRSAHAIQADLVIGLEGGVTGDVPGGASPPDALMKLGSGPGVFLFNGSQMPNRKLLQFTRDVARAH